MAKEEDCLLESELISQMTCVDPNSFVVQYTYWNHLAP